MTTNDDAPLRGDLTKREAVDSRELDWTASPSGQVWRKRLHRVGPAEAGQVTSIVRYEPGSTFPAHDHPEGEEILVLEGVFSDEHGDWPAGTWLLNPEGFRHAPFSKEGCVIFVKLRQAAGDARVHVEAKTDRLPFETTGEAGVTRQLLAAPSEYPDSTWLERWAPGTTPEARRFEGGAEYFVVEGRFSDENGEYGEGTWLRLPPGARHAPRTEAGCLLYLKRDGVAGLRSAPA